MIDGVPLVLTIMSRDTLVRAGDCGVEHEDGTVAALYEFVTGDIRRDIPYIEDHQAFGLLPRLVIARRVWLLQLSRIVPLCSGILRCTKVRIPREIHGGRIFACQMSVYFSLTKWVSSGVLWSPWILPCRPLHLPTRQPSTVAMVQTWWLLGYILYIPVEPEVS